MKKFRRHGRQHGIHFPELGRQQRAQDSLRSGALVETQQSENQAQAARKRQQASENEIQQCARRRRARRAELLARSLGDAPVLNSGWAGRLAGAAEKTQIKMLLKTLVELNPPL